MASEMRVRRASYVACVPATVNNGGADPGGEGRELSAKVLAGLAGIGDNRQFPLRLLILMTSPAYEKALSCTGLLDGIAKGLADGGVGSVPLIGSSTAGVISGGHLHPRGALLVAVASRQLMVWVGAGQNARQNPGQAVEQALSNVKLDFREPIANREVNPAGTRWMLAFFPGFGDEGWMGGYPAPEIHRLLAAKTMWRIPIAGGVSSAGRAERDRPGFQFVNTQVYTDALAVAVIDSAWPCGISVGSGFSPTGDVLHVRDVADGGHRITALHEHGSPGEVIRALAARHAVEPSAGGSGQGVATAGSQPEGLILLESSTEDGSPVLIYPHILADGSLRVLRAVSRHSPLRVLRPVPESLLGTARGLVEGTLRRIHIHNPTFNLMFGCVSRQREAARIGLDLPRALDAVESAIPGAVCVGGLFDGEAGLDETSGRHLLMNWSVSSLVIGDELRERALYELGFKAITQGRRPVAGASTFGEVVRGCLEMVDACGYPGAMLWLSYRDRDNQRLVAVDAVGVRMEALKDRMKPVCTRELLWGGKSDRGQFLHDTRGLGSGVGADMEAVGLISQYVAPLRDAAGLLFGVLEIDLGDCHYHHEGPHPAEDHLLQAVCDDVSARVSGYFSAEQLRISRGLDTALIDCLGEETLRGAIERYLAKAKVLMGFDEAHVRLMRPDRQHLTLAGGIGRYYETAGKWRAVISLGDSLLKRGRALATGGVVVNDTEADPGFAAMLERYRDNHDMWEAIRANKAYADVAFEDAHGNILGTVNIAAHSSWAFAHSQTSSLADFGRRIGVLTEAVGQRISRRESAKRLELLLDSEAQIACCSDYDGVRRILQNVVAQFRAAVNGDVASLFVSLGMGKPFVLWAEDGWHQKGWVDAARYQPLEGVTGACALMSEPLHIVDLYTYRLEHGNGATGKYSEAMFGQRLSKDFNVEAVYLPLNQGQTAIGIMALYRRISETDTPGLSGVTTVDNWDLKKACQYLSRIASSAIAQEEALWAKAERGRRQGVINSLISDSRREELERKLVAAVLEQYHAVRVDLYRVAAEPGRSGMVWAAGETRQNGRAQQRAPDALVEDARDSQATREHTIRLGETDRRDPRIAATEGMVDRAAVPLRADGQLVGILDIRWAAHRLPDPRVLAPHGAEELDMLGRQVGVILETARRAELLHASRRAMSRLGSLAYPRHGLYDALGTVDKRISDACGPDGTLSARGVADVRALIAERRAQLDSSRGGRAARQPVSLLKTVSAIVQEMQSEAEPAASPGCISIPSEAWVQADPDDLRLAFRSILDNAVRAIRTAGFCGSDIWSRLRVYCEPGPADDEITCVFEDEGVGASQETLDAALDGGDVAGRLGMGCGLLIAATLVQASCGRLTAHSGEKGRGVIVRVCLPKQSEK